MPVSDEAPDRKGGISLLELPPPPKKHEKKKKLESPTLKDSKEIFNQKSFRFKHGTFEKPFFFPLLVFS